MRKSCMPFVAPLALLVVACSGSSESTSSGSSSLSGPVDVRLADEVDGDELPPANTAAQVVVTIARIDARVDDPKAAGDADRWTTLSTATMTLDLLALPF